MQRLAGGPQSYRTWGRDRHGADDRRRCARFRNAGSLEPSLRGYAHRRPRALQPRACPASLRGRARLHTRLGRMGRRLGAQGRAHHAGDGARPRPPALRLRGFSQHRPRRFKHDAQRGQQDRRNPSRGRHVRRRSVTQGRRRCRRGGRASENRDAGYPTRQGDDRCDRRLDEALSAQQRFREHGRRRLRARTARRRTVGRHGIRPVLPYRPSRATPDRHGPDHVGSVPLQAGRAAHQQSRRGVRPALRGGGRRQVLITRDVGSYAILKEVEAAAARRMAEPI
jgi:hypothetical protein